MLNVLGVSLSVLSHFLPPQCMPLIFSPCFILGSDWRRVADYCLVFRGGDSGRSAAVRSFSRLCLTGCETHPEWRRSSVHDGCVVIVHGGLRYILDENRNNPRAKRCKQLGYLLKRCTKHCPLQFQLTCRSWNEPLPSFSKSHFHYYAPLIKLGHTLTHRTVTTPVKS